MADIRINALATTAASTASDDYIAIDGSANGTRKLNAYSPTFGGNLTVSGTGNFGGNTTISLTQAALTTLAINNSNNAGQGVLFTYNNNALAAVTNIYEGGTTWTLGLDVWTGSAKVRALSLTSSTATLAGNLTVSGTGTSSFGSGANLLSITPSTGIISFLSAQPIASIVVGNANAVNKYGQIQWLDSVSQISIGTQGQYGSGALNIATNGNALLGTTTDGGQKLQVAGTAYFSGALTSDGTTGRFGAAAGDHFGLVTTGSGWQGAYSTDVRSELTLNANAAWSLGASYAGTGGLKVGQGNGSAYAYFAANTSGDAAIFSRATAALTFSSTDATFAGTIQLNSDSGLYIKQGNIARWTSTGLSSGTARADIYADSGGSFFVRTNGATQALQINSSQNAIFAGSITTAAPTTGTAGAWKLGVKVDATTTLDTTKYLQVDIGGTLYKVALVTS